MAKISAPIADSSRCIMEQSAAWYSASRSLSHVVTVASFSEASLFFTRLPWANSRMKDRQSASAAARAVVMFSSSFSERLISVARLL